MSKNTYLDNLIKKTFSFQQLWSVLAGFVLFDAVSFLTFLYPELLLIVTSVVFIGFLIITSRSLTIGALLVIAELIAGVYGYGLFLPIAGNIISLRMGMFIIWFALFATELIQNKVLRDDFIQFSKKNSFVFLPFFTLILGVFSGVINTNDLAALFFDANAWVWWLYALPFLYLLKGTSTLFQILTAGSLWWSLKALVLIYIFGHGFDSLAWWLYHWLRDYRLAELTPIVPFVYRIFSQSMIFILIPLVYMLTIALTKRYAQYHFQAFIYGSILMSGLIASYSRSFWLGACVGLIVFGVFALYAHKKYQTDFSVLLAVRALILFLIVGWGMWWWSARIPLPTIDSTQPIDNRFSTDEPAATARLRQLQPLTSAIAVHPIIGSGFGAPVTYFTTDPRIVSQTAGLTGRYTTTAFEWGYLDILLDTGLLGIIMLLVTFFYIGKKMFQNWQRYPKTLEVFGLYIAFGMLLVVNITTPYINHPLGIGFVIAVLALSYHSHGTNKQA